MELVWAPKTPNATRMADFIQWLEKNTHQSFLDYQALHQWSITEPAAFWQHLAIYFNIDFITPPNKLLTISDDFINTRWFEGATLNFASHLLKRRDAHPALICLNEQGQREEYSYQALFKAVAACKNALEQAGIQQGDRVAAVLPNSQYAVIAFLATAALGAIWSSCSPDFGEAAIIDRFSQIEPAILFIADAHTYALKHYHDDEKIQSIATHIPSLKKIVICPLNHSGESGNSPDLKQIIWQDFLKPTDQLTFTACAFQSPLCILFSSGTTGKPKCIIHSVGGTLLQHVKELGLHSDLGSNDTLFFYTTCGWMMWNWMVSALALGTTLVLYDGAPLFPAHSHLFDIIEKEKVTVFGTSAKYLSAIEKFNVDLSSYDLTSLKIILSTGSVLLKEQYDFVYERIKKNVQLSSISGGTDIISCFALGNPMLPVYRGELQCFGLGMAVDVFDANGQSIMDMKGELVCTKPFPSMPIGFWNDKDQQAYKKAYFSRYPHIWAHGDFAQKTTHHGLIIHGRSDTVLNPGGVRIGSAEIYTQLQHFPEILDAVVIGQPYANDIRIVLFVHLKEGVELTDALILSIKQYIKAHASARHVPAKIIQVYDIPRTINGKVAELAVKQAVEGVPVENEHVLANPDALQAFKNRWELKD